MTTTKTLLTIILCSVIGLMLCGCESTTTKEEAKEIIRPFYDAGKELYSEDKGQTWKVRIKEKLNDEKQSETTINSGSAGTNNQTTEVKQQEAEEINQVPRAEDNNGDISDDKADVSRLLWTKVGDPHGIVQCYFGYGHDSELFKMIAGLPVDFTCTLDNSGVTISCPTSDDTGRMAMYEGDHMQKRRAFVCLFNADNNLVSCDDFAESFHLDSRWKNKGAVKGLVVHVKRGNALSRTALTEVK
jgi:hypothetical protein